MLLLHVWFGFLRTWAWPCLSQVPPSSWRSPRATGIGCWGARPSPSQIEYLLDKFQTELEDTSHAGPHVTNNLAMLGQSLEDLVLDNRLQRQGKRLTTYAMVRDEIMYVVQARAATGSSPMLVDALTKGKGKGKKGKGEGKDLKSMDDRGKGKGLKSEAKDNAAKSQDSKDSGQKKSFYCDRIRRPQNDPSWTRVSRWQLRRPQKSRLRQLLLLRTLTATFSRSRWTALRVTRSGLWCVRRPHWPGDVRTQRRCFMVSLSSC